MKPKRDIFILILIIVIIVIAIFTGIIFLVEKLTDHFTSTHTIREGARTLPRPRRHPYIENDAQPNVLPYYPQFASLNQLVDHWIAQYFDVNNFILDTTINQYIENWTQKGNVLPETKEKLNDIGYYIINQVLPNVPTIAADGTVTPTKAPIWPNIQWTSDHWFPLTLVNPLLWSNFTNFGMENSPNYQAYLLAYENSMMTSNGGFSGSSNMGTSGSEGGSSGDGGSSGSSGSSGGSGSNSCGTQCPLSCVPGGFLNGGSAGSGGYGGGSGGADISANIGTPSSSNRTPGCGGGYIPGTSGSTKYFGGTTVLIYTTDISQTNLACPSQLETEITDFIGEYFDDSNGGKPTKKAIDLFNKYTEGATPMDLVHKNRLRDFIYYFMQNIIPGLPTGACDVSGQVSYVEWVPIQWLSHSDL
jgi:hypothetical protein